MRPFFLLLTVGLVFSNSYAQLIRRPIPEKIVVLTFDDASSTHATVVAPILKKYGFGGTFFVCECPPDFADKTKYMTWAQIRQLDQMGFEIGNHTLTHKHVNKLSKAQLMAELDSLEARCKTYGIQKPGTFAYPGYDTHPTAFDVLTEKGYQFARIGQDRAYDPTTDHPFLMPSFTMLATNKELIMNGLKQAVPGKIVVLTIHGVPDDAHDWVTTSPTLFAEYMKFLHDNHFTVISLRDVAKYVNVGEAVRSIKLSTVVR